MKVWIAVNSIKWEGDHFLGVAANMEKAKTICGSGLKWEDNPNGKESVAKYEYNTYIVGEEDVIE